MLANHPNRCSSEPVTLLGRCCDNGYPPRRTASGAPAVGRGAAHWSTIEVPVVVRPAVHLG
jgi:hypothetical protein